MAALVTTPAMIARKHHLHELTAREQMFMHSSNEQKVEAASRAEPHSVSDSASHARFLIGMFESLVEGGRLNDPSQAKQLIDNGQRLIAAEDWDDLREVNRRLWELMPDEERTLETCGPTPASCDT